MDTAYLKEFIQIVDHGSMTAAAADLRLTQSALSKHMASLEREYQADLLTRDKTGVHATEAGRILYEHARTLTSLLSLSRTAVKAAAEPRRVKAASAADTPQANISLRRACRATANRWNLSDREVGVLILFLENRPLGAIGDELALSRDELGDLLAGIYRKMGVYDKQQALNAVYSNLEKSSTR